MSTLTCSGAQFGVVTAVSNVDEAVSNEWTLEQWETLFRFCGCEFPGADSDARLEKLWRTLICDTTLNYQTPAPARYEEYFLDFFRLLFFEHIESKRKLSQALYRKVRAFGLYILPKLTSSEDPEGLSVQIHALFELARAKNSRKLLPYGRPERLISLSRGYEFGTALGDATYGRRLFKTKRSPLGLGPYRIQKNDQVWVIFNARMPFVLRPTGNVNEFTLVGDCYMHGEMLDDCYGLKERIQRINIV
jgi:hypothetical protein